MAAIVQRLDAIRLKGERPVATLQGPGETIEAEQGDAAVIESLGDVRPQSDGPVVRRQRVFWTPQGS
jgi:hypothetical protein